MILRLFRAPKFSPPVSSQPHCIAAIPKIYLIVVMHCMSCSHCISNRLFCCGKPSIGLRLEQQPHLSSGALQLLHHKLHCAVQPRPCSAHCTSRICGKSRKICGKSPDIFLLRQRRMRKVAEIGGKSRKVAEKSRKFAESRGKSRKFAERRGNWWKEVAQELALRDAHGSLHRHTVLLHKWSSCSSKAALYSGSASLQVVL